VRERFDGPFFHERVLELPVAARQVVDALLDQGVLAGLDLGAYYDGMENALLVCATERRTDAQIERFRQLLAECLETAGASRAS
jgi:glycine dehydrogenase subunit 1